MINTNNRILSNAIWIIVCRVIQSVLAIVVNMLTARYLGPSNYGLINYAISIVAFATPLMKLGLDNTLVREIINNPKHEGKILGTVLAMTLGSGVICIIGVALFVGIANPGEIDTLIICLLYSTILLAQAVDLLLYWFQAKLLSKFTSIAMLIAYIVMSIYQVYLLVTGKSIYWFALAKTLDYVVIDICLIVMYKKLGTQSLVVSLSMAKELFSRSRYYVASTMLVTVFAQTGTILLKLLVDDYSTGYYAAAVTCAGMTSFVFSAIIDSSRPVILEKEKENQDQFLLAMENLYSITIYSAVIQSIIIAVFANTIIKILYGAEYLASVSVLRIIVWYTTFSYLGATRNVWILAKRKEALLWKINLIGASSNIALNILLISLWGVNGAAFAALFTQIITNVGTGYIFSDLRETNEILFKSLNPKVIYNLLKRIRR